jgi:cytochrome c553
MTLRRFLRGLAIAGGLLVGLVIGAVAIVYVRSELMLRQRHPVQRVALAVPSDPTSIAEGQRLALLTGCSGMCHGREGHGAVMFDNPLLARLVAPNLALAARRYDDAALEGIIRQGVRPDGRSVIVMPAECYRVMTDADLGRIIAYLRTLPVPAGETPAGTEVRLLGRVGFALGKFRLATQMLAEPREPPAGTDATTTHGRYLARIVCGHCHGRDLRGQSNPEFTSPPLQVVRGYGADDFTRLLRTGAALGDRELKMMSPAARHNLSHLTDDEIAALYAYLHTLPE